METRSFDNRKVRPVLRPLLLPEEEEEEERRQLLRKIRMPPLGFARDSGHDRLLIRPLLNALSNTTSSTPPYHTYHNTITKNDGFHRVSTRIEDQTRLAQLHTKKGRVREKEVGGGGGTDPRSVYS